MILQGNNPTTGPSFSRGNRLARALWGLVWLLLFRPSPRPLHGWRNLLLRLFGAQLGRHVHIHASVQVWAPWQLTVGNYVGIGDGARLYNMAALEIGDYCVVSQGAHLCGGSHDTESANFQLVARAIWLEPHVWVAADAFVGPGVRIATGCVIGARAVVMKSISRPWTVWSGNPAEYRRERARTRSLQP